MPIQRRSFLRRSRSARRLATCLVPASAAAVLTISPSLPAATLTWSGAAGSNWNQSPSPWTVSGSFTDADAIPDSNDEIVFSTVGTVSAASGTSSVMNLTSPVTAARLSVTDTGTGWQSLDLNGGTLSFTGTNEATTVTGSFSVGIFTSGTASAARMAMRNGSLVIGSSADNLTTLNRSFNVGYKNTTTSSQQAGVLDLSGLTSLSAYVNVLRVGVADDTGPATGQLTLAPTSVLRANQATIGALNGGATPSGGQASSMRLGSTSNDLQIGTLWVGSAKSSGTVDIAGSSTGSVTLGGTTAGSKSLVNVGVTAINTSFNATGLLDLTNAASFTAKISTLTIGSKQSTGTGTAAGTFNTSAGINSLTIDTVAMASTSVATVSTTANLLLQGTGSANIGSMTVAVGNTATSATSVTSGTVNQTGMAVTIGTLSLTSSSNRLGKGTYSLNGGELAVSSIDPGLGTSRFQWGSATLRATGASSTFITGLTAVTITGSAVMDSAFGGVTIGQSLAGADAASSLTKTGIGSLVLSGSNSYAGGTTVAGGTLYVANTTGSATGSGAVSVAAAGTLRTSGNGNIAGEVRAAGNVWLDVGQTMTTGGLTFSDGATLTAVANAVNNRMGQLVSNGVVSLGTGATLDVETLKNYVGLYGGSYVLVLNNTATDADLNQYFAGLAPDVNGFASYSSGPLAYTIQYNAAVNDAVGNDIVLTFQNVPEPAGTTAVLLAGATLLRRRRRAF